ncbi:dehydrogenase [Sphingomonas sp. Root710]|uniref:SDR family NAD(P)-dependent oxidoreductase n=1 Tax=Sphingomonas sp. Root710 TaxID=1736594 RepID=UPI0006F46C0D|nr:SDR family oxidoreductase [Sphingomonas sp. Root710]KRB85359.1 dehydrogenase [Sphingomonas sp. Root710]
MTDRPLRTRRVAVVTGAGSGIGQAFALRLAKDGHAVAIADIGPADGTVELVRSAGGQVFAGHCDVASGDSVARFFDEVRAALGPVEVLVHNAGIYPMQSFQETDWDVWRRVMSVNLDSAFHLTKAALGDMRAAGWGRIVMLASSTFHLGSGLPAYTASKGGIIGLVRALAPELGPDGITVNAISPSLVRTPGTIAGPHEELGRFERARMAQSIKRTELPEDLVGALSFLASDDSAFMTGQTLVVDGGYARV